MNLLIHIDGGSRGNPGPAAAGVVIQDADDLTTIHEAGYYLGRCTNNVAEYQGLLHGLKVALKLNPQHIEIRSDSELMVRQINRQYKVKSADLIPLFDQAQRLLEQAAAWSMVHVRRHLNTRADELANLAMDAGRTLVVESAEDFFPAGKSPVPSPASPGSGGGRVGATPSPEAHTLKVAASPHATPKAAPSPTDSPRWTLRFDSASGLQCPHPCQEGKRYRLGPTTPAGLCVHAALQAIQQSLAHETSPPKKSLPIQCDRCGAHITLKRSK